MTAKTSPALPANRPLSPHLQIYRWQWTTVLSILHRATGIALAIGTLLLVYWLLAAALGPAEYLSSQQALGHWLGRLLLLGWTASLFYHLFNGIRHLLWDAGKGFELGNAYRSGMLVTVATLAATALAWIAAYTVK